MTVDEFNIGELTSDEFLYVTQFDTLLMLKRILTRDCKSENKYGIKGIDINALLLIAKFPNNALCYYSHKLNMEMGSFNYIVNKLEKLGLVSVIKDCEDKRSKKLILTEKGSEEMLYQRGTLNEHIKDKFSKLTDEERELFISSMKMVRNIALKLVE